MKHRISDLLDSYVPEDLAEDTPLSLSRIKELTMNKFEQENKTTRRFPLRALAVAAVAAALCGSALAAGHILGAGDLFANYFTPKEDALSQGQIQIIDQLGLTAEEEGSLPASVTSNGATITPVAALADENVYYLRLRVEAPEGTVLPDLDPEGAYYQISGMGAENALSLTCAEDAYESFGWNLSTQVLPDADPTDNVKDLVLRWTAQGDGMDFNDGVSKLLTIHGLWIQSADKEYTPVFTGEFTFDIGLHFQSRLETLDCSGARLTWTAQGETYTNTLEALTLSPLSLAYTISTDLPANPWVGVGSALKVVMKDGSLFLDNDTDDRMVDEYLASVGKTLPPPGGTTTADSLLPPPNGTVSGDRISAFCVFDEPLDLDQVDYIQYGETRLYLEK